MFPQTTGMNSIGANAIEKSYQESRAVGLGGSAPIAPGPSVHGALGRLEESVDALQKVLASLGERLQQGGVLAPIPTTGEPTSANRPTMCGLEDRIVGIRMTVDRLAQMGVTVVQSLQV